MIPRRLTVSSSLLPAFRKNVLPAVFARTLALTRHLGAQTETDASPDISVAPPKRKSPLNWLWDWSVEERTIKASGDPDPSVLRDILERCDKLLASGELTQEYYSKHVLNDYLDEGITGEWDSPVLRAVALKRVENLQGLLQRGANPNGMELNLLDDYARRFRRYMGDGYGHPSVRLDPTDNVISCAQSQTAPLTKREVTDRSDGFARFWTGIYATPLDLSINGDVLHSLVMAGKSTPEIFDLLMQAGADATFWTRSDIPLSLPEGPLSPSMLAVSTPLHSALDADEDISMLEAILAHGFNPNSRALIAGVHGLTPMQHAVARGNLAAYRVLNEHPQANNDVLTPVYDVHVLHFAVAHLDLSLLSALNIPLSEANETALGHTLLHIACLPKDELHIQLFAPKVRSSIHDLRTMERTWNLNFSVASAIGSKWEGISTSKAQMPLCDGPGSQDSSATDHSLGLPVKERQKKHVGAHLPLPSTAYFTDQIQVVKHLIAILGPETIGASDEYGNTALHYLVGLREVNNDLVAWLRLQDGGEIVWQSQANARGWTPKDLWIDNVTAIEHYLGG